jgi:hypothetical protein
MFCLLVNLEIQISGKLLSPEIGENRQEKAILMIQPDQFSDSFLKRNIPFNYCTFAK